MTAMMKWEHVHFLSPSNIEVTILRFAPGRKNKNLPTKTVCRSIPNAMDRQFHPITLLWRFRAAVDSHRRRFPRPFPIGVWELPQEARAKGPSLNSADMTTWLSGSLARIDPVLTTGGKTLTARSHRSGAATAALKLRVDDAQICHVADWEMTGQTMRKTYYRPNLTCPTPLAKLFFADLL